MGEVVQFTKKEKNTLSVAALRHFGTRKLSNALQIAWFRQGGKCAYSGLPIELGSTAQLDHVQPQSKHGKANVCHSEVRWVHKDVNYAKGNLSLSQYIKMCIIVLEHFGYQVQRRKYE